MRNGIKKLALITLFLFISLSSFSGESRKEKVTNGAILHCWCWSFKTAELNMERIRDAGFTAIQFSPINECLEGDYGGLDIYGEGTTGKWYYHYQPTDWTIGNYQLGTRDEFKSACEKARECGIAIIVDVLPNHTTPRVKKLNPNLMNAVGGIENLYHANKDRGISNFADRLQCTTYSVGGLPDVNTENPDFQEYFMKYMNDCIACGAGGFRFDTAKHIGLPDDPLDPKAKENDFWEVFTGRKAIRGVSLSDANDLFLYGEVLQGGNSREANYAKYVKVVASSYGAMLRSAVKNHKLLAKGLLDWKNDAGEKNLVTWIESHDTYANQGESAKLSNFELRSGYAVIAARAGGTPLFFNRPRGKEATQFPGESKIGDAGNDEYFSPEVAALNKFRLAMVGEPETLENGDEQSLLIIKRGERGAVIINMSEEKPSKVKVSLNLPDGKYIDKAHSLKFNSKGGTLTGKVPRETIAIIY